MVDGSLIERNASERIENQKVRALPAAGQTVTGMSASHPQLFSTQLIMLTRSI
jgi:hypothetical protein